MKTTARLATIEVDGLRKNRVVVGRFRAGHAPGELVDGVLVLVEGGLELSVGHVAR